jgi:hypothetical protein
MSESDILAIQLFGGSIAVAFLAVGMTAAGWNSRVFVWGMFLLALGLGLVSIFWHGIYLHLTAGPTRRLRRYRKAK